MELAIVVAIFAVVASQVNGQSVCEKIESVYESVCSNQEDDPAVSTSGLISQKIHEAMVNHSRKLVEISNRLDAANAMITELQNRPVYCPIRYNGKCFWVEPRFDEIQCNEIEAICAAHGGQPANIYSKEHHFMLLGHLRLLTRGTMEMNAFLGMRYNSQNDAVTLRDGTPAPYVQWYPTYPIRDRCCCTGMVARTNGNDAIQHFHSWPATWRRLGVICEK